MNKMAGKGYLGPYQTSRFFGKPLLIRRKTPPYMIDRVLNSLLIANVIGTLLQNMRTYRHFKFNQLKG